VPANTQPPPRSSPAGADRQGVGTRPGIRPADVPRRLWRDPVVTHSGDAGGFYCEHAFFTAQEVAAAAGVQRNRHGEPLVGFLHVPGAADRWLTGTLPADAARRHGRTRSVVGRALAGFTSDILAAGLAADEPVRLLVTGFGPWGAVLDNPTGDFVSRAANLQAALASGFGERFLPGSAGPGEAPWRQEVAGSLRLGRTQQSLVVCGWALPTADAALDPAALHGLPAAILGPFRPHAVLCLGVARRRRRYYVEHTADDENLVDGQHQPALARMAHPANFALARAIHRGFAVTW
jgi:pyrrolidone-carboxylate peptidase